MRDFRNHLAHNFSGKYIEYQKKPIKENFELFEKNFCKALNVLSKIYNNLWGEKALTNKTINYIEDSLIKNKTT